MKPQAIRLLDVLAIGPLMIWSAGRLGRSHPVAGTLLAASGVATISYNGRNYIRERRRKRNATG